MAEPELRLLASAIALEQFTIAELSTAAQSNLHTTKSWLRRIGHLIKAESAPPEGRGRPRHLLTLLPEGRAELHQRMTDLQRHLALMAPAVERGSLIDDVTKQFELWQAASAYLPAEAEAMFAALQVAVHSAWQTMARLDSLGELVSAAVIWALADVEAQAGLIMPPADMTRTERARWMAARIARIIDQDATESFAERVTLARLETRPDADKATCAALAGPVWSDEGHADDELGEDAWRRCLRVAELVPLDRRLERVETVLIAIDGFDSQDDGDAQAIVRGLTECADTRSATRYRDWLGAAKGRAGWRDALAPMIVHALSECDRTRLSEMTAPFRPILRAGIGIYDGVVGRLRDDALKRASHLARMEPPAPEAEDFDNMANAFGSQSVTILLGEEN